MFILVVLYILYTHICCSTYVGILSSSSGISAPVAEIRGQHLGTPPLLRKQNTEASIRMISIYSYKEHRTPPSVVDTTAAAAVAVVFSRQMLCFASGGSSGGALPQGCMQQYQEHTKFHTQQ